MKKYALSLDSLVGKLIKVVFKESPSSPVEVRKGKLTAYDAEFIQIKSFENEHLINRRCIISLKVFGGTEGSR